MCLNRSACSQDLFQMPMLTSGPSIVLAFQRDNAVMVSDTIGTQVVFLIKH